MVVGNELEVVGLALNDHVLPLLRARGLWRRRSAGAEARRRQSTHSSVSELLSLSRPEDGNLIVGDTLTSDGAGDSAGVVLRRSNGSTELDKRRVRHSPTQHSSARHECPRWS